MSKPKRVTERHMRVGKNGPTTAGHIDKRNEAPELRKQVLVAACYDWYGKYHKGDLEAHEQAFYEEYFSEALEAANAKHRKARNHKRVKTVEQYRKSAKTCPEDTLYYIGEKGNTATPKQLLDAYLDHMEWRRKMFPRVKVLGFGLHLEDGAPHIEEHAVWTAMEGGKWVVNQEAALRDMGIERPDPSKPVGRFNNAKMTYTRMCREHWIETARSYGFEIIEEPRERGKSGRSLDEFQTEREREKRDELKAEQAALQAKIGNMEAFLKWEADAQKAAEAARKAETERQEQEAKEQAEKAAEAAKRAEEAKQARKAEIERLARERINKELQALGGADKLKQAPERRSVSAIERLYRDNARGQDKDGEQKRPTDPSF